LSEDLGRKRDVLLDQCAQAKKERKKERKRKRRKALGLLPVDNKDKEHDDPVLCWPMRLFHISP
jgi:hypothetical protein